MLLAFGGLFGSDEFDCGRASGPRLGWMGSAASSVFSAKSIKNEENDRCPLSFCRTTKRHVAIWSAVRPKTHGRTALRGRSRAHLPSQAGGGAGRDAGERRSRRKRQVAPAGCRRICEHVARTWRRVGNPGDRISADDLASLPYGGAWERKHCSRMAVQLPRAERRPSDAGQAAVSAGSRMLVSGMHDCDGRPPQRCGLGHRCTASLATFAHAA